jgi:hypothetical protein
MTIRRRKRKIRMTRNPKRRRRIKMPKAQKKLKRKQRLPPQIFLILRTNSPGTLEESVSELTNQSFCVFS